MIVTRLLVQRRPRRWNGTTPSPASWLVGVLFLMSPLAGCSTGQPTPDDTPTAGDASEEQAAERSFGDDPMGLARRWTASVPSDTPESIRERVTGWSDPTVLRLYRVSATEYRAVVAASDDRDAEAVLLTIARGGDSAGDWRVESVAASEASHMWPTN